MAEPRTTLSDEAFERFLADRAPVMAPARLADDVLRGVVGLPQDRREWALPGLGRWSGTRSTLIPVAAVVAVGLLVALLGLVYATRPQPVFLIPCGCGRRSAIRGRSRWSSAARAICSSRRPCRTARPTTTDHLALTDYGATWAPLADQTPFARSWIAGFLQLDHSVLAYGSRLDAAGIERIATWSSEDGASWRLLSDAGSVNPLDGQQREHLSSVVIGGPGFVAIGTATGTAYDGPTAWTSTDGVAWTRGSALGGTGTVGLVRMPAGFLALTWSDRITSSTSTDGITWSPATFPDTVPCCGWGAMANLPCGMPLGAVAVIPVGAGALADQVLGVGADRLLRAAEPVRQQHRRHLPAGRRVVRQVEGGVQVHRLVAGRSGADGEHRGLGAYAGPSDRPDHGGGQQHDDHRAATIARRRVGRARRTHAADGDLMRHTVRPGT